MRYFAPRAFGANPHVQLNSRLYYIWWQWHLRAFVANMLRTESFDLIHHLTWGTLRFPIFLGGLGVPLVLGPLGGGEVAPQRLFAGLPFRDRIFEAIRTLSLAWTKRDPLALLAPKAALLILCKTGDTLNALPSSLQGRAMIAPEIGAPPVAAYAASRSRGSSGHRLLFAARLVGWKGPLLAVAAVDHLVQAGHDVMLEIAGDGPLRSKILTDIAKRGLTKRIRLLGKLPRAALLDLYAEADLFLFPSLHDSSGNVVLEALSRGLPVVCLDLGGPKHYVTPECGIVVSTHERSARDTERALADVIERILSNPVRLKAMSQAALQHAQVQTWQARVTHAYQKIESILGWGNGS